MTLRARLVAGLAALALLGLAIAGAVTYTSLRSFLLARTDATLQSEHRLVENDLHGGDPCTRSAAGPDVFVQLRDATGKVVCSSQVFDFSHSAGDDNTPQYRQPPTLPARLTVSGPQQGPGAASYFTVSAPGGGSYRVDASALNGGRTLVVATPLDEVTRTLHRLLWVEISVAALVLLLIVAAGLWFVRASLRPLEEMGKTAQAIAAGDLGQRVAHDDERTEVGKLGRALNAMLGQIESAFKAREASENRLRRFVGDASHELRTPLAGIRAYAELFRLGARTRPEDLERSMSGIEREAARMGMLVDDLLLLARLDEGRPLLKEPTRLDEVAREAVEVAEALEPGRELTTALEPVTVLGDHDRLRQIVDNLLANVRAHTPPGTPARVTVKAVDGKALLEVSDQGPGLATDDAARVFERFYRADESRARTEGNSSGVGLGLAIVSAVVAAHEGTVAVATAPGQGVTFTVTLPLVPPLAGADVPASEPAA
jgi:two-component system OmpR family sensor kinase